MEASNRTYLPAAGSEWALPLYGPMVQLLGREKTRLAMLDAAGVRPSERVLDIGCGTGTLVVAIKRRYPDVEVVGLDPDPKALERAKAKARRACVPVRFDRGFADELPYPDESFDRVFSSFMFHHLEAENREKTLREVRRVLAPGGSFHLLDYERPEKPGGLISRHLNEHFKDNTEQRIVAFLRQAGFASVRKATSGRAFFGLIRTGYYQAA